MRSAVGRGIEVGGARSHSRRERHIRLLGRQGGKKDIREWIGIAIFIQGNWSIRGVAIERSRCWRKHDRCGLVKHLPHYSDWMQVSSSYLDLFMHKDPQCIGMKEIIQYSEIIGDDSEGFGMDLNGIPDGFEL